MLVYYLVMPLAIKFFLSFESSGISTNLPIQLEAKVNEYLSLVMKLIFAFGIRFQLPVVLSLLARVGVVDSEFLKKLDILVCSAGITGPNKKTWEYTEKEWEYVNKDSKGNIYFISWSRIIEEKNLLTKTFEGSKSSSNLTF